MTLISFSGTTSQGPFWQQILDGKKTQTCRRPRKRPIRPGDVLHLYWKSRVQRSKKPVHLIGITECVSVNRRRYMEFASDDAFARRDGFRDARELRRWFGDPHPLMDGMTEYDVIEWGAIKASLLNVASGGPPGEPETRRAPPSPELAQKIEAADRGWEEWRRYARTPRPDTREFSSTSANTTPPVKDGRGDPITVYCDDPVGECEFCEYARIHESGYGYVCINPEGKLYGQHITSIYRGVNCGCSLWEFWKEDER